MTAVQEDQLPSLNRLRVARKVIGTLRLAIEKVQGTLSPEEVNIHQSEGCPIPRHPCAIYGEPEATSGRPVIMTAPCI